jgi:hypothetical protein
MQRLIGTVVAFYAVCAMVFLFVHTMGDHGFGPQWLVWSGIAALIASPILLTPRDRAKQPTYLIVVGIIAVLVVCGFLWKVNH